MTVSRTVHSLAAALALAATGCAAARPQPAAATGAPTAAAAAAPPPAAAARTLAPLSGDLASADAKTFAAECERLLGEARAAIAAVKATPRPVPRARTEAALALYDESGSALDRASGISELVFNANPDPAMRAAGAACTNATQRLFTEISLDRGVYEVLAGLDLAAVDPATRFWIERDLLDFRRAGVDRDAATRHKVQALRDDIVQLGQKFDQAINDATLKVALAPAELAGMPPDYIAKHPPGSDGKVVLTTQYPDYFPFMSFAKSSAAREKMYRAFRLRAHPENGNTLKQLLAKRHELATLLGYGSWAAYSMEDKMIRTPAAAHEFVDQIVRASDKRAAADYKLLLARLQKDQPRAKAVPAWDAGYLIERVHAEKLGFDAQSVRPYFEFGRVQAGLLELTARLFGIEYRRVADARVWHKDVDVYDVFDGGTRLGRIYLDLHPRPGKFSHAAQLSLASGREGVRLPEGVLLCNFPNPSDGPALLQHDEVKTFFHEFGHLLHHVFSGHTRWVGTANLRESDFVEAPSQLLEEWIDDAATLQLFARHRETNQPIPTELVERMRAAQELGRGLAVRRQMVFAALSLQYHDHAPRDLDTNATLAALETKLTPYAHVEGTAEEASFGHLSGYSSNYYTYMWSLVIAKDLFTPFKAAGLLDHAVAMKYRHAVLEAGGTRPAAEMVRAFLGRPFSFKAYEAWLDSGNASAHLQ